MKIQCACGARFSFDITPELAAAAVQFVCPTCGLNSTSLVNHLIHQHATGALPKPGARATTLLPGPVATHPAPPPLAVHPPAQAANARAGETPAWAGGTPALLLAASASPVPVAKLLPSGTPSPSAAPVATALAVPAPAARVAVQERTATAVAPAVQPAGEVSQLCTKHFGQLTTSRCFVCQKPICPQCMALFGWVCSPLCKHKAESQGIAIPECEGQKSVAERKEWRKLGRTAGAIAGGLVLVLGVWFWYAWFGSAPKPTFSARLPEAATSGQLHAGPQRQFIILHGGTLARHDAKAKREVWSVPLIDKRKIADEAAVSQKLLVAARMNAIEHGADSDDFRLPLLEEVTKDMLESAAAALHLHVAGNGIWVQSPEKLVRYDWETGKPAKEIALDEDSRELSRRGNEFLLMAQSETGSEITRIDLASGETRAETVARPAALLAGGGDPAGLARSASNGVARAGAPTNLLARAGVSSNLLARIGLLPGARELDPAIENLPLPNRLALPATLAAAANQQRLRAALNDFDPAVLASLLAGAGLSDEDELRVIPTRDGYLQFGSKLVEHRTVTRKVMKEAPAKSALDGPVNQAATLDIANEILNEITRESIGDTVEEDESRYQATLRRPGAPDWTGEVIGRPGFIPLDTVDLVTSRKAVLVLDKKNKKLWQTKLTSDITGGGFEGEGAFGAGPAVERGDTLYLFDAAVLTAFERATGNARWRLPSVGIAGLFFDDKGMIYVNTSTASPDSLRYSRQIDISQKTHTLVLKVDPKTGKTLWRTENDGLVTYLSGKYIYTVESSQGEDGGGIMGGVKLATAIPPHIRIKRLKPSNGRVLWEHYEMRAPLDYHFDQNEIQILFRKELQVLRFMSL